MGDDVLISLSSALKKCLRRSDDYCFRLGGEEFGIIFKVDKKDQALVFADMVRQSIEDL